MWALLGALGADVTDDPADADAVTGFESSYLPRSRRHRHRQRDVFPKVNSLVVDADVYDSLTDEQRTILNEAATTTTNWAIDTLPTDADAAAAYCDGFHSIVEATDTDLQSLHDAAAPVVAELRQDPATARMIDEIEQLAEQSPVLPAASVTCEAAGAGQPTGEEHLLNGVYQFDLTVDDLHAGGLTDPRGLGENHGSFTFTFADGHYAVEQRAPDLAGGNHPEDPTLWTDEGTYIVSGGQLTISFPHDGPPTSTPSPRPPTAISPGPS